MDYLFFGFLLILFGVITLIGVSFELGWFTNHYQVKSVYKFLCMKGAKAFYIILSIILILGGIWALGL